MPPLGVELAQLRTRFQKLLPASPQLVGGSPDTRLFWPEGCGCVGVAAPGAGYERARGREKKDKKGFESAGGGGGQNLFLVYLVGARGGARHSRSIGFAACDRPHNPTDE